jgi:hypothetical protein
MRFSLVKAGYVLFLVVSIDSALAVDTAALYAKVSPSVCVLYGKDSLGNTVGIGSGFLIRSNGVVATNAHVIAGFYSVDVKCGGSRGVVQLVQKFDLRHDLAVLSTTTRGEPLPIAAAETVQPGTQIFAFGSPLGLEGTISEGLASGTWEWEGTSYLQISTPISPGNSGGPVTNASGAVLGIAVSYMDKGQNLNFAVPAPVLNTLPTVDKTLKEFALLFSKEGQVSSPTGHGKAKFRGLAFGSPCVLIEANERVRGSRRGSNLHVFEGSFVGSRATITYQCSGEGLLIGGKIAFDKFVQPDDFSTFYSGLTAALDDKYGAASCRNDPPMPTPEEERDLKRKVLENEIVLEDLAQTTAEIAVWGRVQNNERRDYSDRIRLPVVHKHEYLCQWEDGNGVVIGMTAEREFDLNTRSLDLVGLKEIDYVATDLVADIERQLLEKQQMILREKMKVFKDEI